MIAAAAIATLPQTVHNFDAAAEAAITRARRPVVLKLDSPRCAQCAALDELWNTAGAQLPAGTVWRASCADGSGVAVCANGDASGPRFMAWDGENWRAFAGVRDAQNLVSWVMAALAPTSAAAEDDDECRGDQCAATSAPPTEPPEPGRLRVWPGQALPTLIFLPAAARARAAKLPIFVYLHGTPPGGRFDVLPSSNGGGLIGNLLHNETFASRFPFIALLPCSCCDRAGRPKLAEIDALKRAGPPPTEGDIGWTPANLVRLEALVEAAAREFGGDRSRVFLTGQSYGGKGVWDYGAQRPSAFAALVPVCPAAQPSPDLVAALCCDDASDAQQRCCPPIWAFHGANDVRADVRLTDMWVEALRAQPHRPAASPVRYSRYPEAPPTSGEWEGHGADQLAYADEELYEWLLGLSAGGEEAQPEPAAQA